MLYCLCSAIRIFIVGIIRNAWKSPCGIFWYMLYYYWLSLASNRWNKTIKSLRGFFRTCIIFWVCYIRFIENLLRLSILNCLILFDKKIFLREGLFFVQKNTNRESSVWLVLAVQKYEWRTSYSNISIITLFILVY